MTQLLFVALKPISTHVMKKNPVSHYNDKLSQNNDLVSENNGKRSLNVYRLLCCLVICARATEASG